MLLALALSSTTKMARLRPLENKKVLEVLIAAYFVAAVDVVGMLLCTCAVETGQLYIVCVMAWVIAL